MVACSWCILPFYGKQLHAELILMNACYKSIIEWISVHGDAEFTLAEDFRISTPASFEDGAMVYCPKARSFLSFVGEEEPNLGLSIQGVYGVPDDSLRTSLVDLSHKKDVWFFGDLDGPDLMSYIAFDECGCDGKIKYLGISDRLLAQHDVKLHSLSNCLMEATAAEKAAVLKLASLGVPLEGIVGQECYSLLLAGKKIETEGLFWSIPPIALIRGIGLLD